MFDDPFAPKKGKKNSNPFGGSLDLGLGPKKTKDTKRTLGIRDKQILYRNAKGKCENPACGKKIDFDEMQTGHKNAHSKGGSTTLRNSVCLCYRCNKLQGTDSWATFLRKQKVKAPTKPKTTKKKTTTKKKDDSPFGGSIFGAPPKRKKSKSPFDFGF